MGEAKIIRRGGGVDVADATASTNDVLQGETFYSGDKDIKTGNIPSKGAETFTPTTSNQTISSGQYLSGTQTILGDPDLVPSNIVDGVSIFGVTGNAQTVSYYLSFDGVDDYVAIQNDAFNPSSSFEIDFNFTVLSLTAAQTYLDNRDNSSGAGFRLVHGSNNQLVFELLGTNVISNDNFLNVNQNYEIKISYDGSTLEMYNFNNLIGSVSKSNGFFQSTGVINIGSERYKSRPRERWASMKLYNFLIKNDGQLTANYLFNQDSGSTLIDSVNNYDGTIVGATWVQE